MAEEEDESRTFNRKPRTKLTMKPSPFNGVNIRRMTPSPHAEVTTDEPEAMNLTTDEPEAMNVQPEANDECTVIHDAGYVVVAMKAHDAAREANRPQGLDPKEMNSTTGQPEAQDKKGNGAEARRDMDENDEVVHLTAQETRKEWDDKNRVSQIRPTRTTNDDDESNSHADLREDEGKAVEKKIHYRMTQENKVDKLRYANTEEEFVRNRALGQYIGVNCRPDVWAPFNFYQQEETRRLQRRYERCER